MWEAYPSDYRAAEVSRVVSAVRTGDSVAIIGLSGAGKSNLMGFMAHRVDAQPVSFVLVDCNKLRETSTDGLFRLVSAELGIRAIADGTTCYENVDNAIRARFIGAPGTTLCLLFDRFDAAAAGGADLFSNLRALRDTHKYKLTYVFATRHALPATNELAELLHANTIWIGPLVSADARWTIQQYARRKGLVWSSDVEEQLMQVSHAYPSLLRGACEARAAGVANLEDSETISLRVSEFWADAPTNAELVNSGLHDAHILIKRAPPGFARDFAINTDALTGKEMGLLKYLQSHPHNICAKDDIIRSVWTEDQAFVIGVRDESLAQLIRRLREKIEPDSSKPRHIVTVPGRGYKYVP